MAKVSLGNRSIDWDTKADVTWSSVTLQRGRGYYFYIEALPLSPVWKRQYVNLFARYTVGATVVESLLLGKFFNNGVQVCWAVPVPNLSILANNVPTQIVGRPREFYAGSGTVRLGDVRVSWEDSGNLGNLVSTLQP